MTVLLMFGALLALVFATIPYLIARVATSLARRVYRRLAIGAHKNTAPKQPGRP